jgi:hypothetical protein
LNVFKVVGVAVASAGPFVRPVVEPPNEDARSEVRSDNFGFLAGVIDPGPGIRSDERIEVALGNVRDRR